MQESKELSFKAASELTGLSAAELRREVRAGRLDAVQRGGRSVGLSLGALSRAGLLPDELGRGDAEGGNDGDAGNGGSLVSLDAGAGTYVPAAETHALLRHLLSEREALGAEWKETTERLYREIIDEQRQRVRGLEEENRELRKELADALRRIPKLMELEDLERARAEQDSELSEARRALAEAEAETEALTRRVADLDGELTETRRRRDELAEVLRGLRRRGLWERVIDREPRTAAE